MKEKFPKLLTKKVADLLPAKYNPRNITDEALGRLTKSLAELGNLQPITWNAKTGNVVGGHQRLKCYQAMGKEEVEVWAVWLEEAKEKAANIALNKLSGEFDMTSLKDLIEEIDTGEIDLEITGFSETELQQIMSFFKEPTTAEEEWKGMPEFEQNEKKPFKEVVVRFVNDSDYQAFANIINQNLTLDTKSIWFPKQDQDQTNRDYVYGTK